MPACVCFVSLFLSFLSFFSFFFFVLFFSFSFIFVSETHFVLLVDHTMLLSLTTQPLVQMFIRKTLRIHHATPFQTKSREMFDCSLGNRFRAYSSLTVAWGFYDRDRNMRFPPARQSDCVGTCGYTNGTLKIKRQQIISVERFLHCVSCFAKSIQRKP